MTAELTSRRIEGVSITEAVPAQREPGRPPLVMVHGGCHAAWCWQGPQAWFASRGWYAAALDWYSHGDSEALPQTEWCQREIVPVREEIGIVCAAVAEETGRAPVVIGHSMGGLASLAHATVNDQEIAALVLLAPVVPGGYAASAIELPVDSGQPWGPPPPDMARQLFYSGVDDAAAARYYELLQPESPAAVWQATRWTADLPLDRLNAPALVYGAEKDLLVPPDAVQRLSSAIGADYVHLPDTGHGLTLDPIAEEVCERTEEWLSGVLGL